jgi:hypothetical protein
VTGRISGIRYEEWVEFDRSFGPVATLHWVGWNPERIKDEAERLLSSANYIDPLEHWHELARLVRFDKWQELKGDALVAMDHRIAAEMLLLFYEDLARADVAPPLEPLSRSFAGPRHTRLATDRSELDSVLMEFAISPQPSLVLVLEGGTEMFMVRRVMKLMGIPLERSFIDLFNIGGVKENLALLASYIATPEIGMPVDDYLLLKRPPTNLFLVIDPEGAFKPGKSDAGAERRWWDIIEAARQNWVGQIWNSLAVEHRTEPLRKDLESLIRIETWNDKGESFEFANFTDQEIADAILTAYTDNTRIKPEKMVELVSAERANPKRKNIKKVWQSWAEPQPDKIGVAAELWPVLEKKIQAVKSRDELRLIPIVRIIQDAAEIASRSHRYDVAIRRG